MLSDRRRSRREIDGHVLVAPRRAPGPGMPRTSLIRRVTGSAIGRVADVAKSAPRRDDGSRSCHSNVSQHRAASPVMARREKARNPVITGMW